MRIQNFLFAVVIVLLLSLSGVAQAATVTLTWDPPTTNADGTPLTDLAGYKVYHGTTSRTYGPPVDAGNVTSYTLTGIPEGVRYFTVTAYDTSGNESTYSNEVQKQVVIPPMPPALRNSIIVIISP